MCRSFAFAILSKPCPPIYNWGCPLVTPWWLWFIPFVVFQITWWPGTWLGLSWPLDLEPPSPFGCSGKSGSPTQLVLPKAWSLILKWYIQISINVSPARAYLDICKARGIAYLVYMPPPPPNWISSMNNDWSMIKIVIYSECNFYYAYVSTIPKKIGDYSFIAQNYRAS